MRFVSRAIFVVILLVLPTEAFSAKEGIWASQKVQLDRLIAAYPDYLKGHSSGELIWKDGTRMRFDDGVTDKKFDALLNHPDLQDQFYTPYHTGRKGLAPARNIDPGRVRYEPFFTKMYGDCRKGQVKKRLRPVAWLPRHGGRRIMVTTVNGVARRLEAVSRGLEKLLEKKPGLKKFLIPTAGTYNCRVISGTGRYSVHSYGAAMDIAVKQAHYWRWVKPTKAGTRPWRNRIPLEVVEIFERHGFIWGGKWYHFDTMHFEYRPELLGLKG